MYAVGQNVEQKLVCKQRSEICLVSGINCMNHFALSWNSVFCSFIPFHARHFIIHSADSSPTDCLLHLSLDDVRIFRLPVEFFYARQLFFSFFSLINNRKRGHAIITANSLGLFFLLSFFFMFICPMRQQHWTNYKISLCVCQSVSQWVSQSVNFETPFISRERLKLETSNLANRLATGGTDEKMQN